VVRWLRGNRSLQVGILVLIPFFAFAAFPHLIAPYGPNELVTAPLEAPSHAHWLGTDEIGRDILSRTIFAARNDLGVSLASTALAALVGIALGLVTGYRGGLADALAQRLSDVILSFPAILLAIFLITILGRSQRVVILTLAILFMPGFQRLARTLAIALRERGFVEASIIAGGGTAHIARKHLFPNAIGTLLVGASLTASYALLTAATLSYLGLGTQPPNPSWGNMLQDAFSWVFRAPLYGVVPGVCITLVALGYVWFADGVEFATQRGSQRSGGVLSRLLRQRGPDPDGPAAGIVS
jgi:peptide/nickel transport system permease protein